MRFVHFLTASGVAALIAAALTISPAGQQDRGPTDDRSLAGVGGAGAFIAPAHVNGPFGAGGPLAGVGGAGAFIPSAQLVASLEGRFHG
jgi:hypothetical protein